MFMCKLVEFSVSNFRSILERRTLSLESMDGVRDQPNENKIRLAGRPLLVHAAIYGANSSGKSNVVMAMGMMREVILGSVKLNDGDLILSQPVHFQLSEGNDVKPTSFEIVFIDNDGVRYRYGFDFLPSRIVEEWLFVGAKDGDESLLFGREGDDISMDESFVEGELARRMVNSNRLFLSLVGQLGGDISRKIINFFRSDFIVITGVHSELFSQETKKRFYENATEREAASDLFGSLALGFSDFEIRCHDGSYEAFTAHDVVGGRRTYFRLEDYESEGTQKLFNISNAIIRAMSRGSVFVIDELDAQMHPLISREIIRLFGSKEKNPGRAQIIFTTHDTNLLSSNLLRRDEIWFTEKDGLESTDLYCLMEINYRNGRAPQRRDDLAGNYINGRYGAIPFL